MKITVYTITDCQFSKQEKEYLVTNKLAYEEKNLETNKDWLTEMLAVSNNFAGTPVTKIDKDDGQIVVLKGFTKDEFDKALGLTPPADTNPTAPGVPNPSTLPTDPAQKKPADQQLPPLGDAPDPNVKPTNQGGVISQPVPTAPVNIPPQVPVQAPAPIPPPTNAPLNPPPAPVAPDPLASVLSDLETKVNEVPPANQVNQAVPPAPTQQQTGALPTIPDFNNTSQ